MEHIGPERATARLRGDLGRADTDRPDRFKFRDRPRGFPNPASAGERPQMMWRVYSARTIADGCFLGEPTIAVKQLIADIARVLVDIPDEVSVRIVKGAYVTVFELGVAKSDIGKVIGRGGRTANSMRIILDAAGKKLHRRFTLEILDH